MRRSRIFSALLAVLATCTSAAPRAGAQAAGPVVREKTPAPVVAKGVTTPAPQVRRDTAEASKSVSEKLFDARWVVFPARLALVSVSVTIAVLLMMGGMWSTARVVHSLWHTKWSQPPRKLKRGEVGAAGTSLAVEFEERMEANLEQDAERDQQIAELRASVTKMITEHKGVAAAVAALLRAHPEVIVDGPEIQG